MQQFQCLEDVARYPFEKDFPNDLNFIARKTLPVCVYVLYTSVVTQSDAGSVNNFFQHAIKLGISLLQFDFVETIEMLSTLLAGQVTKPSFLVALEKELNKL